MVIKRKTRNLRRKAPLWICLVAGVSAVAMVALVVLFSARTVQADAGLHSPALPAPAASPRATATPPAPPPPRTGKTGFGESPPGMAVFLMDARQQVAKSTICTP